MEPSTPPTNQPQQPTPFQQPVSSNPTNPQSTALPTQPPKQEKKRVKPFIIVLIVIILGIVGYTYLIPKLTKVTFTPSPTPLPTSVPTIQPSPNPSDEITYYTNEKYGVSFIHPSNWGIKDLGQTLIIAPEETIKTIPNGGFEGGSFLTMTISLSDVPYEPLETDEYTSFEKKESMTVGGKSAKHFTATVLEDGPGFGIGEIYQIIRLQNGNNYYNITLLLSEYKEIFDEILSSLEFFEI